MPPGTVPMAKRVCGACSQKGHRADHCPNKGKKTTGTGTPSKPAPKVAQRPAAASEDGFSGKALAAHVRQLHADIERGKAAEDELADIKKAIAGL